MIIVWVTLQIKMVKQTVITSHTYIAGDQDVITYTINYNIIKLKNNNMYV